MNNYYIPEIKEICSGFECEIKPRVKTGLLSWAKQDFTYCDFWEPIQVYEKREGWDIIEKFNHPWSLDDFVSYLKDNAVRVKYLDQEDIEEIGWEDIGEKFNKPHSYKLDNFWMDVIFALENTGVHIYIKNHDNSKYTFYNGNIKNKSELKWIMKKTGI
jgi:hypothetical protein